MGRVIKMVCPICGSDNIDDITPGGEYKTSTFICDECNHEFLLNIPYECWTIDYV